MTRAAFVALVAVMSAVLLFTAGVTCAVVWSRLTPFPEDCAAWWHGPRPDGEVHLVDCEIDARAYVYFGEKADITAVGVALQPPTQPGEPMPPVDSFWLTDDVSLRALTEARARHAEDEQAGHRFDERFEPVLVATHDVVGRVTRTGTELDAVLEHFPEDWLATDSEPVMVLPREKDDTAVKLAAYGTWTLLLGLALARLVAAQRRWRRGPAAPPGSQCQGTASSTPSSPMPTT